MGFYTKPRVKPSLPKLESYLHYERSRVPSRPVKDLREFVRIKKDEHSDEDSDGSPGLVNDHGLKKKKGTRRSPE